VTQPTNRLRLIAKQWRNEAERLLVEAKDLKLRAAEIHQRAGALEDELDKYGGN
jgi:hypothetical protein